MYVDQLRHLNRIVSEPPTMNYFRGTFFSANIETNGLVSRNSVDLPTLIYVLLCLSKSSSCLCC